MSMRYDSSDLIGPRPRSGKVGNLPAFITGTRVRGESLERGVNGVLVVGRHNRGVELARRCNVVRCGTFGGFFSEDDVNGVRFPLTPDPDNLLTCIGEGGAAAHGPPGYKLSTVVAGTDVSARFTFDVPAEDPNVKSWSFFSPSA